MRMFLYINLLRRGFIEQKNKYGQKKKWQRTQFLQTNISISPEPIRCRFFGSQDNCGGCPKDAGDSVKDFHGFYVDRVMKIIPWESVVARNELVATDLKFLKQKLFLECGVLQAHGSFLTTFF